MTRSRLRVYLRLVKAAVVQGRARANHHQPVHAPSTATKYRSLLHHDPTVEQQEQQHRAPAAEGRCISLAPLNGLRGGEGRGAGLFTNFIHTARRVRWWHDRSCTGECPIPGLNLPNKYTALRTHPQTWQCRGQRAVLTRCDGGSSTSVLWSSE